MVENTRNGSTNRLPIENVVLDGAERFSTIVERLIKAFGRGDNGGLRIELYRRVQAACEQHGERAYRALCQCVRSSQSAVNPPHYFAAAVSRRFREMGFILDENADF